MQRKPITLIFFRNPDLPVLLVGVAGLCVALGMSLSSVM